MEASFTPLQGPRADANMTANEKENPVLKSAKETASKARLVAHNVMSHESIALPAVASFSATIPHEAKTPPETTTLPSAELPKNAAARTRADLNKRLNEAESNAEINMALTESSREKPAKALDEINKIFNWEKKAFARMPTGEPPIQHAETPRRAEPGKSILRKAGQKSESTAHKRVNFSTVTKRTISREGAIEDKEVTPSEISTRKGSQTTVRLMPKIFVQDCIASHIKKWERTEEEPLIDYKTIKAEVQLELFTAIQKHPFREKNEQEAYYKEVRREIRAQIEEKKEAFNEKLEAKTNELFNQLVKEWKEENPGQVLTRTDRRAIKEDAIELMRAYLLENPNKFRS